MKINSLLYRTKVVLESEDDLFPGIDSSAFDTDSKAKEVDQDSRDELFAEYRKLRERANKFFQMSQKMKEFLKQNDAMIYGAPQPNEVNYRDFGWLYKYEEERQSLASYSISKNSPLFDTIEKYIHDINKYSLRHHHFADEAERLQMKLRVLPDENK